MAAPTNLITTTELSALEARKVDFTTQFERNWTALTDIIGVMRPIKKAPGTRLYSYKVTMGELQGGDSVAEGEEIPLTTASFEEVPYGDITLEKYAKAVSIEAVEKYGAAVAVDKTDEEFRYELQTKVLDKFYDYLQTGTLEVSASTFQEGIALAIGSVKQKFQQLRRTATGITVFVNTYDVYKYLGTADISIQSEFGLDYIKDFMGANTVILSSEIPSGKIIAVPQNNIVNYYVDPSDADFSKLGLNYTVSGETNLIGYATEGVYGNAIGKAYAVMGMYLFAEYLDAIAVATVSAGE